MPPPRLPDESLPLPPDNADAALLAEPFSLARSLLADLRTGKAIVFAMFFAASFPLPKDEVAAAEDVMCDVEDMVNGVADWPDGLGEVAMMSAVVSRLSEA